jgi:glycosyltransferase involved in cell wall biosynthesis
MPALPGYSVTISGEPSDLNYYNGEVLPRIQRLRAVGVRIDLHPTFTPEEKVGELFQSHSIVVLPYTRGFVAQSGVVFMALAYEIPVIASEAGGLADIFAHHKIGVTFDDPSPAGLASAVHDLYSKVEPAQLRDEIHAAKQHFSWHDAAGVAIGAYGTPRERRMPEHACALETNLAH